MAKKVAIANQTNEELLSGVGRLEALINSKSITWTNAKGEARTCPYSVFSHTGKLLVSREDDAEGWDAGTAVQIKVEAERRNGGMLASVRATHAVKAGTCSATVRTAGMNADISEVTVQLADAQKLQGQARAIRAELFKRAEAEKEAAAIEAEAAKQTKVNDLVKAAFSGGSITAEEAEMLNVELSAA